MIDILCNTDVYCRSQNNACRNRFPVLRENPIRLVIGRGWESPRPSATELTELTPLHNARRGPDSPRGDVFGAHTLRRGFSRPQRFLFGAI